MFALRSQAPTARAMLAVALAASSLALAGVAGATGPAPYGFADFFAVPQLGYEAVRGTGCGGDGSIGDVIPDGYWRGYVRAIDAGTMQFDLVCVYIGHAAVMFADEYSRTNPGEPSYWWPDGWPISNNPRTRTVALAASFFAHGTVVGADGSVPFNQPGIGFDASSSAWIQIAGGQAQWAVSGPVSLATPTVQVVIPATTVAPTAPPTTAAPAPVGYGYDDFLYVPQLGNEPVRGTGCGGDGSIGDVIPDGYWRGFVRSWNGPTLVQSSSLQFDLMCVYIGDTATQLADEYYAANPGAPDVWWPDGWPVNNNDRTRTVPIATGFFAHGSDIVGDGMVPFDQPGVPFDPAINSWLRIVNGQAVWAVSSAVFN